MRALFRRKKAKKALHEPVIVHEDPRAAPGNDHNITKTQKITEAELESSADSQALSAFFTKLPLEIRRMVYREVWRTYLQHRRVSPSGPASDMGLHIYTDGSVRGSLAHTRCMTHPEAPAKEDAWVTAPWPFDNSAVTTAAMMPPRWFWMAWVMRLNWGRHWNCQHAIQQRWDPATGRARPRDRAPFLSVWLTCKKMFVPPCPHHVLSHPQD